jgi:DnaJ family protein C protein 28
MRREKSVKVEDRKSSRDWEGWIDQQIREAQDRGKFDDLPGKGRPLDLVANPYAKDQQLAFKVLKDAGYAPDWIELDKALRGKLERARTLLVRRLEWREMRLRELADQSGSWSEAERLRVQAHWEQALSAFALDVEAINREIVELNLIVPSPRFQRSSVDVDREIERLIARAHE